MNVGTLSLQTRAESAHTTLVRQQLLQSFRDPEYRRLFVEERVRAAVALQIRALRQQHEMTQSQLGQAIGMAQTWVSKLEDPDYGKMTVATLLRLAGAFDADLEIKFRPFSRTLDSLPTQGPDYFYVPTFDEEFGSGESDSETIGRVRNIENARNQGVAVGAVASAGLGQLIEHANALASSRPREDTFPQKRRVASAVERTREDQYGNHQGSARQSSMAL